MITKRMLIILPSDKTDFKIKVIVKDKEDKKMIKR